MEQFKWDGCSDNLRFGVNTGKQFADAAFSVKRRRKPAKKSSRRLMALLRTNVTSPTETSASPTKKKKSKGKRRRKKAEVNIHNNDIGRQVRY